MINVALLCGGSGTRLWPSSRASYPKQFAPLIAEHSLFQLSAQRFGAEGFGAPIAVTSEDFRFIVAEQMRQINMAPGGILIEPEGRDTAGAVLAAALWLEARDPEALLLVAPSDHDIPDPEAFCRAVEQGEQAARDGQIVTFGIAPDRPETGYGWLELEAVPDRAEPEGTHKLCRFVEKPDQKTAVSMLSAGRFLWNAGIFLFDVKTLRAAYETHAPELLVAVERSLAGAKEDLDFTRLDAEAWSGVPKISIDYAIMERADNLSVVPYHGKWSDLGDWDAVWRDSDPDENGMVCSKATTSIDCQNTLLRADDPGQQVVGIGLDNLVVVAMKDAVLVANKDRAQEVKQAVSAMRENGITQADQLPRDYRPWGWYETLILGNRFQVKRIVVHPGAALSLQSHHHRSEHWIVVAGTAKVTVDEDVRLVTENQSVYIPLGAVHRMENPGKMEMVLIEVQTGSYLGEDDILRYDDIYARS